MTSLRSILLFLCFIPCTAWAQTNAADRVIRLEGRSARVVVEIDGGAISAFHLVEMNLNPLSWREASSAPGPHWRGHFLCLDRWGSPSDAERHNGMPFHGEASRVEWKILQGPVLKTGQIVAEMAATLPLAGLKVRRRIRMSERPPFLRFVRRSPILKNLGEFTTWCSTRQLRHLFWTKLRLLMRTVEKGSLRIVLFQTQKSLRSPGRRRLKMESLLMCDI